MDTAVLSGSHVFYGRFHPVNHIVVYKNALKHARAASTQHTFSNTCHPPYLVFLICASNMDDWEQHKDVLRTLYSSKDREVGTLRSIMVYMEARYSFVKK